MTDIVYTLSKYVLIICFGLFTFLSFRVQRDIPEELKTRTYRFQRSMIIAIHAIAFFVISLHVLNRDTDLNIWQLLGFYLGQLAYILIMTMLIPRFVRLNHGLNNVMVMFLTVGFIIQTRLSFDDSVRQFIIVLAGTVICLVLCFFCKRAHFMRNLTWIYCILGMGLLFLVLVLSTVSRGARLSLQIGPFSFQPLEFVKILFVLFVASAFHRSNSLKMVIITAVCAAVHILIQVFCNDLGSAFILFVIYLLMLYAATRKFVYILLGVGAFSGAAVLAYHLFNHVRIRVSTWLDPWTDINGKGYQIAQSLFAIGTGSWFGSGLFLGNPTSIPLVSKDMVISAISEELGALFAISLILLCLCFTLMVFRVAIRIELTFYKLLAYGLGVSYAVQVFLTIGGALKFIPLTGVTLPFVSNGGSSILASFVMIGIIQSLYVISESDVAHERRMVAAGVDLSNFAGYEDLAEDPYESWTDEEPVDTDPEASYYEQDLEDDYREDEFANEYEDEYVDEYEDGYESADDEEGYEDDDDDYDDYRYDDYHEEREVIHFDPDEIK